MVAFEVSSALPEIASIATVEGTVKLFSIDLTTSGFADTRMSMSYIGSTILNLNLSLHQKWIFFFFFVFLFDTAAGNVVFEQIFDCNVNERNGKHYVNVTSVRSKMKIEGYSFKFESQAGIPWVTKTINHVMNANWRLLLAEDEATTQTVSSEITQALFTPIFNKFPIQYFFQEYC